MLNTDFPPFPASPTDMARLDHLPTVETSLRYWGEVLARTAADSPPGRTAATLCRMYASARDALYASAREALQADADLPTWAPRGPGLGLVVR